MSPHSQPVTTSPLPSFLPPPHSHARLHISGPLDSPRQITASFPRDPPTHLLTFFESNRLNPKSLKPNQTKANQTKPKVAFNNLPSRPPAPPLVYPFSALARLSRAGTGIGIGTRCHVSFNFQIKYPCGLTSSPHLSRPREEEAEAEAEAEEDFRVLGAGGDSKKYLFIHPSLLK